MPQTAQDWFTQNAPSPDDRKKFSDRVIPEPIASVRTPQGGYKVGDTKVIAGQTLYVTGFYKDGSPLLGMQKPASPHAKPGPYQTKLDQTEESAFQQWVKQNNIPYADEENADYDMRGYFKALQAGDPRAKQAENKHFPDIWKTPYHKTFSRESMYALPTAPKWVGGKLMDDAGNVLADESGEPAKQPATEVAKPSQPKTDWFSQNPPTADERERWSKLAEYPEYQAPPDPDYVARRATWQSLAATDPSIAPDFKFDDEQERRIRAKAEAEAKPAFDIMVSEPQVLPVGHGLSRLGRERAARAGKKTYPLIQTALEGAQENLVDPFDRLARKVGGQFADIGESMARSRVGIPGVLPVDESKLSDEERDMLRRKIGIGRGLYGAVGGVAGDPRYWPLMFTGGTIGKLLQVGFTGQMMYGTAEGIQQYREIKDRPDVPLEQKYEVLTSTIVNGLMAAHASMGMLHSGKNVPGPMPKDIADEVRALTPEQRAEVLRRVQERLRAKAEELFPKEKDKSREEYAAWYARVTMEPLPFDVNDLRGREKPPSGQPQILDVPVLDANDRAALRWEQMRQETYALIERERQQRVVDEDDRRKRLEDEVGEQQRREMAITERRTVAPKGSQEKYETAIQQFRQLGEAMDRMAQERMYENAADRVRSLLEQKPRGKELNAEEKEFLKMWEERKRLVDTVDPREPVVTEFGKERMAQEAALSEREQKLREAAARLSKEASESATPDESKAKGEAADEAARRAEELKTQVDRQRAEREAALEKQKEFPEGTPAAIVAEGRATDVRLPDGRKVASKYAIVKAEDLITSHDPFSFTWNEEYQPRRLQPRDYEKNKEAQSGVISGGQNFEVNAVHNTDDTGHNGPPVILRDGRVAGGNGRAMRIMRAYKEGNSEAIRDHLAGVAEMFGLDPAAIPAAGEHPVLVRLLDETPTDIKELIELGQDLNRTETRGFTQAEQSVMSAERISQGTMDWLSLALERAGEDISIRELMRIRGNELVEKLAADGLFEPTKRAQFVTSTGELTEDAKRLFENALLGKVIDDADLIATMPPFIKTKLFRALASLAKIKAADPAWDFTDYLQESIRNWKRIEAVGDTLDAFGKKDAPTADKWYEYQKGKMIPEPPDHPAVVALTKLLEKPGADIKEAFTRYADEIEGKQEGLAFRPPMNPRDAFNQHVAEKQGVELKDGEWGSLRPAREVAEPPAEEAPDTELAGVPDEELKADYETVRELYGDEDPITQEYKAEIARRREMAPLEPGQTEFLGKKAYTPQEAPPAPPAMEPLPIPPEEKAKTEVQQDIDKAIRTSGPLTEEKLRDILSQHPNYSAGKIGTAIDVWKRFAENYLGVPFDQWLAENASAVEIMGPGPTIPAENEVPTGVLFQPLEPDHIRMIREGGGIPVGIQEGFGDTEALALFNHPETKSTLAIKVSQLSADSVRARLAKHLEENAALRQKYGKQAGVLFQREWGAGFSPEQLESWARAAGRKLSIEDYGQQMSLFGAPENVYRLKNSAGESVLVTQTQMDALRKAVPEIGARVSDQGTVQGALFGVGREMEPSPKEPGLFDMAPLPEQSAEEAFLRAHGMTFTPGADDMFEARQQLKRELGRSPTTDEVIERGREVTIQRLREQERRRASGEPEILPPEDTEDWVFDPREPSSNIPEDVEGFTPKGELTAGEQQRLTPEEFVRQVVPEGVTGFASGSNRVADIRGFVQAGVPVGVDVSVIGEDAITELESLAGKNIPVFLDSGAFSETRFEDGKPIVDKPIHEKEWTRRLDIYDRLAKKLGSSLTVVAPDMVGQQKGTIDRLFKFGKRLQALKEKGVRIVIPIQFGDDDVKGNTYHPDEFWFAANDEAGFDIFRKEAGQFIEKEDIVHSKAMIPGFPMNKAAMKPEDVMAFVRFTGVKDIHLLGMGISNAAADPLVRALRQIEPDLKVTFDANALRAHTGGGRGVTEAQRAGATRESAVSETFKKRKIGGQFDMAPLPGEEPPKGGTLFQREDFFQGSSDVSLSKSRPSEVPAFQAIDAQTHDIIRGGEKIGEITVAKTGDDLRIIWAGEPMRPGAAVSDLGALSNQLGVRGLRALGKELRDTYGAKNVIYSREGGAAGRNIAKGGEVLLERSMPLFQKGERFEDVTDRMMRDVLGNTAAKVKLARALRYQLTDSFSAYGEPDKLKIENPTDNDIKWYALVVLDNYARAEAQPFDRGTVNAVLKAVKPEDLRHYELERYRDFSEGGWPPTLQQSGKKGAIQFLEDGKALIHLMENADISTVFHEFAHMARRNLKAEDRGIVEKWLKVSEGAWGVDHEEKFARAFERYLYDGEAPTSELKSVFARIRDWMIQVYRAVKGSSINIKIPDEVRKVFDRMVGGDEEVPAPFEEPPAKPADRTDLKKAIDKEAKRMQDEQEKRGDDLTPEERLSGEKIAEGGEAFADDMEAGRFRGFPAAEDAIKWAAANKDKLRGVKIYQLPDGGAFAHFIPHDPKVLFQETDPTELDRRIRLIDERMGKLIPEAERLKLGKMRQDLVAQKSQKKMGFMAPLPGDKPITLWTPEGEVEVGGKREERRPDAERTATDVPAPFQEPKRTGEVPKPAGQPGRAGEGGATGRGVRGAQPGGRGERAAGEPRRAIPDVPAAKLDAPARPRGEAVYAASEWSEAVKRLGLPSNAPVPTVRIPTAIRRMLFFPGQPEVVESALSGLKQHDAFIVATGTGSGKTYTGSALLSQLYKPGMKALVLTTGKNLIHGSKGWIPVARDFDVDLQELGPGESDPQPGAYVTTYATAIGRTSSEGAPGEEGIPGIDTTKWDVIIADEIGEARKWYSSQRGAMMKRMADNAGKVVYMSATPFHTALEIGHMGKLGLWRETGFDKWAYQFGVRRDAEGNYTGGNAPKKLIKLREQLIERGQFINIEKNLEGFNTSFAMVPLTSAEINGVKNINEAFAVAEDYFRRRKKKSMIRAVKGNAATYIKKYLERTRLPQAVEMAKKLEAEGWKVIIFSETRSERNEVFDFLKQADEAVGGRISELLPPLPGVAEHLQGNFGEDIANYSGPHSAARDAEKDSFIDNSKKHIYVSYAAGGIGVSLHDELGTRPRAVIYLGPPYSGIMFDQAIGRAWRYGTKSNVHAIFLTSNAMPEINMIAGKVAPRMSSLRAMVSGIDSQDKFVNTLHVLDAEREKQLGYELGQSVNFDPHEYEQTVDTHAVQSWKDVKIGPASEAMNKGMKMPEHGVHPGVMRLFQGDEYEPAPFDLPEDKESDLENDRMEKNMQEGGRLPGDDEGEPVPAPTRFQMLDYFKTNAKSAADAAGDGEKVAAVHSQWKLDRGFLRNAFDAIQGSRVARAAKAVDLYMFTNGRKVIRRLGEQGGGKAVADTISRMIPEYHVVWGNVTGPWVKRYFDILKENDISKKRLVSFRDPKTGEMKEVNEHHNMVFAKEGKQPPGNPRIARAVEQVTQLFQDVKDALAKENVATEVFEDGARRYIPFAEQMDDPNYWPRKYDLDYEIRTTDPETGEVHTAKLRDLVGDKMGAATKEKMIRGMMRDNNLSRAAVEDWLASRHRDTPLVGNVERARQYDLPYYRTDANAAIEYLEGAGEAVARTRIFGQRRQKVERLLESIPGGKERRGAREVVDSLLAGRYMEDDTRALMGVIADWSVMTKMGFSAIKALGHSAWAGMYSNTRAYLTGMFQGITDFRGAHDRAVISGAVLEQYKNNALKEYGTRRGSLGSKFLDYVQFHRAYEFGRMVSDAAARVYLEKTVLPKLLKGKSDEFYRRTLKDIYFLDDKAIDEAIATGSWSEADLNRAGKALADKTMFTNDPTELPPLWRARAEGEIADFGLGVMRAVTLLKGYSFKVGAMLRERLIDEARQGNFRPWIPFMLVIPELGALISQFNSLWRTNRKEAEKQLSPGGVFWTVAEDIAHMTGMSTLEMLFEMIANPHSKGRMDVSRVAYEFFLGPAASDLVHTVIQLPYELTNAKTDQARWNALKRWLRSTFPVSKLVVPPPERKGASSQGSRDYHMTPIPTD